VGIVSPGHPYKRLVVPHRLEQYGNGKLPTSKLAKLSCGGTGWFDIDWYGGFVFACNLMYDHAKRDGITLKAVSGGYRSFEAQEALFFSRYSLTPTGRVPQVTRTYKGRTYFLNKGASPSASPGTSPHGWACAQDFLITGAVYDWLCRNAPTYGIFLQGPPKYLWKPNPEYEAWHWQLSDANNPTKVVKQEWKKFRKALGLKP